MVYTNHVNLYFIIEQFNNAKIPGTKLSEDRIKEAIYKVLNMLGNLELYDFNIEELKAKDGIVEIPRYIKQVSKIIGVNGERLVIASSGNNNLTSKYTVKLVRNRLYIPKSINAVIVSYLGIPLDDKRNPLVLDNEYVINAVISYLVFITAKSLWLSNRLSSEKYRELEQDWLYHAPSAQENLKIPSDNEIEEWDSILQAFPFSRLSGI